MGRDLARLPEATGCRGQTGVGTSFSRRELCSRQKRGDGVGKTKVGKGSKVMAVVDGNGLPIGLHVDSARPHEVTLAEPTLQTISVPRQRGRPKMRPKELVADKAYDSADFLRKLRRRGIKPTIATFERRKRKSQNADALCALKPAITSVGKSSAVLAGWTIAVAWWCARTVICISTVRFVSSPSFCGALTEF